MAALFSVDADRLIQSATRWYWKRTLRHTSIQYDDALQVARLRIFEKRVPLKCITRQVPWILSKEFVGHKEQGYPRLAPYFVHESFDFARKDALSSSLTDTEYQTLLENMWAVGHPGTYAIVLRYLHGETTNTLSPTILRRATGTLAKAYTSAATFCKPEPALWLPRPATAALKRFKRSPNEFSVDQTAFFTRQLKGPYGDLR